MFTFSRFVATFVVLQRVIPLIQGQTIPELMGHEGDLVLEYELPQI